MSVFEKDQKYINLMKELIEYAEAKGVKLKGFEIDDWSYYHLITLKVKK